MSSVYKDLLAYGKGFPPNGGGKHHANGGASYDFVFTNTLRSREYRILGKKGEGTFSEVLKCQHVKDGTYYACKKMKQHYDGVDQVNNLREIQAMRRLNPHANIIGLHEIIYDKKTGTVALICELMDMNIYEMIRGRRHYLPEVKIKNYMYQLLKSLDHMHRCGIFHRDVKPENILIKDDVLKLADFGSCRSVYSKPPYTEYISTRWYRAPECLLTDGYYSYRMDLWSVGCVFFEVMSLHPLFPGSNEVDQIAKIHDVLGTPDSTVLSKMKHRNRGINFDFPPKKGSGIEKLIPHASAQCLELIYKMCTYDPEERITAKQALRHSYFRDLRDAEKKQLDNRKSMLDTASSSVASGTNTQQGTNKSSNGNQSSENNASSWRQNQIQKKRKWRYDMEYDHDERWGAGNSGEDEWDDLMQPALQMVNVRPLSQSWSLSSRNHSNGDSFRILSDTASSSSSSSSSQLSVLSDSYESYDSRLEEKNRVLQKKKVKQRRRGRRRRTKQTMTQQNRNNRNHKPLPLHDKKWNYSYNDNSNSSRNRQQQRQQPDSGGSGTVKFQPLKQHHTAPAPGMPPGHKRKTNEKQNQQRRQRRLAEQQKNAGGGGLVVKNSHPTGGNTDASYAKAPMPHLVGGAKSVYSTSLPKVHLPRHHHQYHHNNQTSSNLLPGILKTNMLQPKTLHKTKVKQKEPKSIYGSHANAHYQLPAINRHLYHH